MSEIVRTSIALEKEMHDKFRIKCMTDHTTMSKKMRDFIEQYMMPDVDFDQIEKKIPDMEYDELANTHRKIKMMFSQLDSEQQDRARKINDMLNRRNEELRGSS